MTSPHLLIVADDLTGACDTAGAVVAFSGPVTVHLHTPPPRARAAAVVATDLDSRSAPVAHAVERTITAVSTAPGDVYLKIDSTLRGHVVETVSAAAGAFRATHPAGRVAVCPAFPARGRSVKHQRVVVNDRPLASDALVQLASLPGIEVADAATDADLAALVRDLAGAPVLWVGSAGLAPHVAAALAPAQPRASSLPAVAAVAVVVGSRQPASVEGAAALATRGDERVRLVVGDPRRPAFAEEAAAIAAAAGALVATGGYTARRVLERLAIDELRVCGEMEAGIPWSLADGPVRTVVTKAGGFGDAATLGRLVDRLLAGADSA